MTRPRTGSICSGYGGLDMAVEGVLGGEIAWVADNDPGAALILAARFPAAKNLGDITAVDWAAVEPVDVLTAGFPCQDVSCAGGRAGLREGNRTGVWAHVARAIDVLRPPLVVLENVRGLLSAGADSDMEPCPWCLGETGTEHALRASGAVLADLADLGYDAEWATVSAAGAGAPHRRERVFITAWPAADPECDGQPGRPPEGAAGTDPRRPGPWAEAAGRGPGPAEDTDRPVGGERWFTAPGQAPGWRSRPDTRRSGGTPTPADTPSERPRLPERRISGQAPDGLPRHDRRDYCDNTHWGTYAPAIRRWETILGRPAPRPTEPGRTGERLSPVFVEWMMGLPEGWVTAVPGLTRNAQLKALGNGVVPAQAAMALRMLLPAVAAAGRGAA